MESLCIPLNDGYLIECVVIPETGSFIFNVLDAKTRAVKECLEYDLIGIVIAYGDYDTEIQALFEAQSILLKVTKWINRERFIEDIERRTIKN